LPRLLQKQTHLCENKQLHYQVGDLEKIRLKNQENEVLHFLGLLRI
jgi:hypothetical protein